MEEERLDVKEEWKKDYKLKPWYALRKLTIAIWQATGKIQATESVEKRG